MRKSKRYTEHRLRVFIFAQRVMGPVRTGSAETPWSCFGRQSAGSAGTPERYGMDLLTEIITYFLAFLAKWLLVRLWQTWEWENE